MNPKCEVACGVVYGSAAYNGSFKPKAASLRAVRDCYEIERDTRYVCLAYSHCSRAPLAAGAFRSKLGIRHYSALPRAMQLVLLGDPGDAKTATALVFLPVL